MSFLRFLAGAACAAAVFSLSSCSAGGGTVNAVNPTVAEMDRMDVQWGLTPRKSRGAPRRSYQYQAGSANAPLRESAPAADVPPARETVIGPPPAALVPEPVQPDPAAIKSLR